MEHLQFLKGQNLFHETASEIQEVKKEINETLIRKKVMWNQRSRELWLKCGDRNTKVFHSTVSQRRKRNRIERIIEARVWFDSPEDIERVILNYFSSIYSTDHPTSFEASLNEIGQRVTQEMNGELLRMFREEKIRVALNQMHPTKALGLDCMSPIFFQQYWDVVGQSVVSCVSEILNTGVMPSGLNETYICLILKVSYPQKITEFLPINLCNVVYKILSKVLANRLKKILPEVINESQSAFVPRR